jgi:DNA-binding beta-propeller fold protein YncE
MKTIPMHKRLAAHLHLLSLAFVFCVVGCANLATSQRVEGAKPGAGPAYAVDPYWPKPLPNQWLLGQVAGIATDKNQNIWVIHRPNTLTEDERGAALSPARSRCCVAAPPVLQFDPAGNLLQSGGGPGAGYEWPKNEHGIYADPEGNIWLGGNDAKDHMILKFTAQGKFLMQIGYAGQSEGSLSQKQLGRPAHMEMDVAARELYVADGYQNRRVVVFNSDTGAFKRMWGAYGQPPKDGQFPSYDPQANYFGNPVHCVRLMRDGTVLVCDRMNNRIQVFTKEGQFIRQMVFEPNTRGSGSVWDLVVSEDPSQTFMLIADGTNNEVRIAKRDSGEVVGTFGRSGRQAGDFHWVHNIAIDNQGNLYTAEVDTGKRAQKFMKVR